MHGATSEAGGKAAHEPPAFRVLGSLEVWDGAEPVVVAGALRNRTLAMLLLEAGRVVPVSRLVDAAWDGAPPRSATHQIRKAVADLRQRIPHGHELILTDGPGYRAALHTEQLDLTLYRRLLRQAHDALEERAHKQAAAHLRAALELWRGPVLAGAGGPILDAVSTALEEQRLAAAERLYELVIEAGEAASVIGELRSLTVQYPLRETLRGQLILALYQTGQQAAALEEFAQLRVLLADELGIDPSTRLSELHEHVLQQDPALRSAQRVSARLAEPVASAAPRALPYDVPDFSGRTSELSWIAQAADRTQAGTTTVLGIDGMGGGGKTALALRAAHRLAARYPDGQLFIDLRGFTPGQHPLSAFSAQGDLLAAAGIPSEEIPGIPAGRNALWQSYMRGRRMLLVLDNASASEQVRTLIPTSPGSLTLITSRPRLTDLDGVEWLSLGVLTELESREILRQTLGAERVAREPEASAELLRLCGGLPLAVRIAAARLSNRPGWSVQRLVDRLRDHGRRLEELSSQDRGVASALTLSYQAMPEDQRTAFRLLGHSPGRYVDAYEAAALLGTGTPQAEDVLENLVDVRLLEAREPGTYAFHDLVRHFARRLSQGAGSPEADQAVHRLLDHYVRTAEHACDVLFPGRTRYGGLTAAAPGAPASTAPTAATGAMAAVPAVPAVPAFADKATALRWLDQHRDSLLTAVDIAHARGSLWHAARLPRELGFHSSIRSYDADANRMLERGVEASRQLADPALTRLNLTNLAMGLWRLGRISDAVTRLEEALEISQSMNDRQSEAECKARLSQAFNSLGHLDRALRLSEEANQVARATNFTRLDGSSLSTLSHVQVRLGRYAAAARSAQQALAVFDFIGETQLSVDVLRYLSRALEGLGCHDDALVWADEAIKRCHQLRMTSALPLALARRTDILLRIGQPEQACENVMHALSGAFHHTDDVHRASVHLSAGRAHHALGDLTKALGQYQLAHEISSRMELRYEQAQALDGLAATHEALGDGPAAGRHRQEADRLFSSMGVPDSARGPGWDIAPRNGPGG